MASAPPIAKVTRPVPAGFFPRKRLYRLLDKCRKAPLLWITGPPGCGKTTLISSYVESRRLPCLWYKVDEGDGDLATFFYYLGLAARRAAPRKKRRLPLLTPDRLAGLSVFTQRYFESLSAMLPLPCFLVLDDCHRVQEESLFFETLRDGTSRLAPGVVSVLVSRHDPHSSFARERANRHMEVFGWEELRLTPQEASGIARMHRRGRQAAGLVSDLFERTDGWAAGLVLLLERTDRELARTRSVGIQMPDEIIDYFGSEIFQGLGEEQREFLLRTAFLPRMTASMAERLTHSEGTGRILASMNRQNLFTEKHPAREPVYAYHSLFREFLMDHARDSLPQKTLAKIRNTAAAILEETGYVEDAATIHRNAGNWERLAKLILAQARDLVSQGRNQTLLEWLGDLPLDNLENEPWLLYWNGVGLMSFSPAESRARFEKAFHAFEARQEAPGIFLAWAGVIDSFLMEMESFRPTDHWIFLLPRLLDQYQGFPSEEIEDLVTCSIFNVLVYRRLPGVDLQYWADRAQSVARKTSDPRLKIESGMALFLYGLGKGGFSDAETTLTSLRHLLKQPLTTPLMRIWVDWMEALLSIFLSDYERCLRIVSDAISHGETTGVRFLDNFFAGCGTLCALNAGDVKTANRYFHRMASSVSKMKPIPLSFYFFVAGCMALYRRDLEEALHHAEESIRQLDVTGNMTVLPIAHLLAAHIHHRLEESEDAAGHLEQARRVGSDLEFLQGIWLCALNEAYFHDVRGDESSACNALREGMRIGREHGFVGTWFWWPGFLERIAAKALEEGIEVDYARELIRRNRLIPGPNAPALEQWPWPVKVFTLGRFRLLVDDRPVEFGRKVQQRPLSLLKALIALGGKDVAETRLTELLWPDADGDLTHQSFTSTLNRLRKILGAEEALALKEGRLSLSDRHCWVDTWAFQRFVELAEKARKECNRDETIRHFEHALHLYRGSFLPFEEPDWAISTREKLRSSFLGAVTRSGRLFEESNRWEEAISCYGKGLEADDLAEELYRRLMICHLRQGREAEALSVYRRCRRTLSSVLGVKPSSETQEIADSIRGILA